jgi:malate dehydrogenase (oxaloacetate-decarboxylating)(NADP+)
VATRPISDFDAYRQQLNNFVWQSGLVMKPVFQAAKRAQAHHLLGGRSRARAARGADGGGRRPVPPILIGRPDVVVANIERFGLRLRPSWISRWSTRIPTRYDQLWGHYHSLMERKGVSVDYARARCAAARPWGRCCSSSATPTG